MKKTLKVEKLRQRNNSLKQENVIYIVCFFPAGIKYVVMHYLKILHVSRQSNIVERGNK